MSSSSLPPPQIPLDHTHKQLLFHPSSPAATFSWSPPSPSIHTTLLALGHANGISIYRQGPSSTDNTLDRAEAFRKRYALYEWDEGNSRWSLEHVCDGTLGTNVSKVVWAPTSTYNPSGESSITLLTLSSDHTARMIYFPSTGGTLLTLLGGTSGHQSHINDIDSILHPSATGTTNEELVVATTGDDNTLIIWQWDETGLVPTAYSLTSPGVSVGFCKHFPRRLLVAEEEGTIRILDWLASDDARVTPAGGGSTLWLLNIHMGVGLSMGVHGLLASAEWCGDGVDGEGGRIVGVTKGGEWAVWDLSKIEGAGRTVPVERGQVIHANNVVSVRSHPTESGLFAIASKGSHQTPALHIIDLTHEQQTNPHPIHSLPTSTLSLTSLSWHPTESVLAATLSSGSLLITRVGERSDGEKVDRPRPFTAAIVLSNGYHDHSEGEEYEEEGEPSYEMSFEDSYVSRRGEEMIVDEED